MFGYVWPGLAMFGYVWLCLAIPVHPEDDGCQRDENAREGECKIVIFHETAALAVDEEEQWQHKERAHR